jgi:hypothetical protein
VALASDAAPQASAFAVGALQTDLLAIPVGAFLPVQDNLVWLFHPDTAHWSLFQDPSPVKALIRLRGYGRDHQLVLLTLLATPLAACWLIVRSGQRVAEFAIVYIGVLLFAYLRAFPGSTPPRGPMLVVTVWMSR